MVDMTVPRSVHSGCCFRAPSPTFGCCPAVRLHPLARLTHDLPNQTTPQMVLNRLQHCGSSPQPCPVQAPAEAHRRGKERTSSALSYPHSMRRRLPHQVVGQHAVAMARQRLELVMPTRRSVTDCWPALQQRCAAMCAARPSPVLQQPDACAPLGPWPPTPLLVHLPMLTAQPVRWMTRLPRPSQLLCWLAVRRWQSRAQAMAPG